MVCGAEIAYGAAVACYAVSGTEIACGATMACSAMLGEGGSEGEGEKEGRREARLAFHVISLRSKGLDEMELAAVAALSDVHFIDYDLLAELPELARIRAKLRGLCTEVWAAAAAARCCTSTAANAMA
eukprot:770492-Rhodomonas_salina.1